MHISEHKARSTLALMSLSLLVIICQCLFFYTKPNNAMETCGFRASVAIKKLKEDAQRQADDATQAMFAIYMTQLQAIPQPYYVLWEWWLQNIQPTMNLLKLWTRDMEHYQEKIIGYLPSLALCQLFFKLTLYLYLKLNPQSPRHTKISFSRLS